MACVSSAVTFWSSCSFRPGVLEPRKALHLWRKRSGERLAAGGTSSCRRRPEADSPRLDVPPAEDLMRTRRSQRQEPRGARIPICLVQRRDVALPGVGGAERQREDKFGDRVPLPIGGQAPAA